MNPKIQYCSPATNTRTKFTEMQQVSTLKIYMSLLGSARQPEDTQRATEN